MFQMLGSFIGHTLPSLSPGSSPNSSLPGPATMTKNPSRTTYNHILKSCTDPKELSRLPADLEVLFSTKPSRLPLENHIRSLWHRTPCLSHSGS